jgi:hypothetical protein
VLLFFHKWTPPVESHYKLNFSCKFGVDGATVGIGVIIPDSLGLVAAVKCFQLTSGGDMLQVHARAVLAALEFAYSIGLLWQEVEVGHQELLGLIYMSSPCLAPIGVPIEDICSWIHLFHFMSFSFIRTDCNKALQALATKVLSSFSDQVWLEEHPDCIISFVQFNSS